MKNFINNLIGISFLFLLLIYKNTALAGGGCTTPGDLTGVTATAIDGTTVQFGWTWGSNTSNVRLDVYNDAARTSFFGGLNSTSTTGPSISGFACGVTMYYTLTPNNTSGSGCSGTPVLGSVTMAACPANVSCAGATSLTYGIGTQAWNCQSNRGTPCNTTDAAASCWSTGCINDLWYRVTVPAGQTSLYATTDEVGSSTSTYQTQVAIYSGSCGSLTQIACSGSLTGFENLYSSTATVTGITPGTYYIRVDGNSTATGTSCIKVGPVPSNNTYCTPTTLVAGGGTINGSTYGANRQNTAMCADDCLLGSANSVIDCGPGGGASIENNTYYLMPCGATGGTGTLSLGSVACNGTNGLQLWQSLNQASCTTFNSQKNDGGDGEACNSTAAIQTSMTNTFNCPAGATVRVTVDGFAGEMCTFGINFTVTPLPIEMKYFKAEYEQTFVALSWATSSETNNDYFELERSEDGITFYPIATVKGAGNSTEEKSYRYNDHEISGLGFAYYRIKQVDFNGESETFSTEYLQFDEEIFLKANPNPTNDFSTINFYSRIPENATVTVRDLKGNTILNQSIVTEAGQNEIKLDLSNNAKGIYLIDLNLSNRNLKTKLIKTQN